MPRLRAELLTCLALLACAYVLVAQAGDGWFVDDDFTNMRWVLESKDRPWSALFELTSVHDHVRPFNLIAHWAGAKLSDGDWWGPHAVLVALILAGFAGVMALAWRRSGPPAAVLAGALALAAGGLGELSGWNAWIGSAGEIACGIWALVAADYALAAAAPLGATSGVPSAPEPRPSGALPTAAPRSSPVAGAFALSTRSRGWVGLAALLLVSAGLFKEPGWIVYPLAIAAMAAPRLGSAPTARWLLVVPILGALGFALTFHPANTTRYLEVGGPLPQRVAENAAIYGSGLLGARWEGADRFGIAALPLFVALWAGLLGRAGAAGLVAVALGVGSAALAWDESGVARWLVLALPVAVLVRRWRAPPPELVMAALALLVMVPNKGPAHTYALTTAYGLAVFAAVELVALWRETELPDVARAALFGAFGVQIAGLGYVAVAEPLEPRSSGGLRDRFLAVSALVATLEPHRSEYAPPRAEDPDDVEALRLALAEIGPLLGEGGPPGGREVVVKSSDATWRIGPAAFGEVFRRNLAPHFGSASATSREVSPIPGWWAVGMVVRGDGAAVTVRDACSGRWSLVPDPALEGGSLALQPLRVTEACSPLVVSVSGVPWYEAQLLMIPLDPPRLTLGGAGSPEQSIFDREPEVPEGIGVPQRRDPERPRPGGRQR